MLRESKFKAVGNLLYNVPKELKEMQCWVVHKNKIPLNANTLRGASSTDEKTWTSFHQALETFKHKEVDGVGFCFRPPYIGIDIDKSLDLTLPHKIQSYTEYSHRSYFESTRPIGRE